MTKVTRHLVTVFLKRLITILVIILSILNQPLLSTQARPAAVPVPTVSLNLPAEGFIGENVTFTVSFDNTNPVDVGYGPYIDLYMPATGVDGFDGLTFLSATYLSFPLNPAPVVFTLPAPAGCVSHPYAVNTSGAPVQVCGTPGDQLVVILLPFGSFVPDQPRARCHGPGGSQQPGGSQPAADGARQRGLSIRR